MVSVIIPSYNHGKYLAAAINSVLAQQNLIEPVEVIVIDDGSVDNTAEVVARFENVKYHYQENQGLSSARNAGIDIASGDFLLFLDADDWLLPKGITDNLSVLRDDDSLAFVSGCYKILFDSENYFYDMIAEVEGNYYIEMLKTNYIGVPAAVLFRRWVFDSFRYDTTLKACEDYDLYLNVTRKFKVKHHSELIAVYRFHQSNMSGNPQLMLDSALKVLRRQEPALTDPIEISAYNQGLKKWKDFYTKRQHKQLYHKLSHNQNVKQSEMLFLKENDSTQYLDIVKLQKAMRRKRAIHLIKRIFKIPFR